MELKDKCKLLEELLIFIEKAIKEEDESQTSYMRLYDKLVDAGVRNPITLAVISEQERDHKDWLKEVRATIEKQLKECV